MIYVGSGVITEVHSFGKNVVPFFNTGTKYATRKITEEIPIEIS